MKKHSASRLTAAIILFLVFLGELYLSTAVLNQYGTSSMAMGHLFYLWGMFLSPVLGLLVLLPVYENDEVRVAVTVGGIVYAAACAVLYQPAATLYATGLASSSLNPGYYVLAAKVVLVVAALLVATITPKAAKHAAVPVVTAAEQPKEEGCCESCSEELTDEQAASMKDVLNAPEK